MIFRIFPSAEMPTFRGGPGLQSGSPTKTIFFNSFLIDQNNLGPFNNNATPIGGEAGRRTLAAYKLLTAS